MHPLTRGVNESLGYARCSLDEQDLTAQRGILLGLGVTEERIYLDHGLTGTNRDRPGLDQALAAVRAGDTLVVPKLDRLARSVPDARDIGDDLAARGVKLSLGGQGQQRELARMAAAGEYTIADLAEVFTISRATVYRTLQRSPAADKAR